MARRHTSKQDVARNSLLAGSISGIASTVVMYPMDVIRTKMQRDGGRPLSVLRQTIQHGGLRAIYTEMTIPLAAQAIYLQGDGLCRQ
jgi:hypothetical protein